MIKQARFKYHHNLQNQNYKNPKNFWKAIKKVFPCNNASKISTSNIDDVADKKTVANNFCQYFSNIAFTLKQKSQPLRDFIWRKPAKLDTRTDKQFKFEYVSKTFVERELKSLKRGKAAGHDDIPPGMLKDAASIISKPLCYLINLSLQTGIVPAEWKIAKVKPIHKSGSTSNLDNYRPISILPVLSKILERAVHKQLTDYLESNKLLSKNQHGYRRKRSTEQATTLFTDSIRKEADRGKLVGALFVDLSKAFHTLSHSILLYKLKCYGITGIEHQWLSDYLFRRRQMCIYEGISSEEHSVTCGVPQGSILGPLLFLIYFNDLEDYLIHSYVIKFADDTVLFTSDRKFEIIENKLNTDLDALSSYLMENELVINLKKNKTESMVFGTAKRLSRCPDELNLVYQGTKINSTTTYKYLGTVVDQNLNMGENFHSTYKKTSSKLRLLEALKPCLTKRAVHKIYHGVILPTLLFNCVVDLNFSRTRLNLLSSIDRRVAAILGEKQTCVIDEIYKHAVLLVKKCLDCNICEDLESYFEFNIHCQNTRQNSTMLSIPKVKLELAKSGFFSMGVKIFNTLPIEIRRTESFQDFRNRVISHFNCK